mgnify:CR=1 FL=1
MNNKGLEKKINAALKELDVRVKIEFIIIRSSPRDTGVFKFTQPEEAAPFVNAVTRVVIASFDCLKALPEGHNHIGEVEGGGALISSRVATPNPRIAYLKIDGTFCSVTPKSKFEENLKTEVAAALAQPPSEEPVKTGARETTSPEHAAGAA